MSIAITQNGTRIMSGSIDGAIRMWDAETHKALVPLFKGTQPAFGLLPSHRMNYAL